MLETRSLKANSQTSAASTTTIPNRHFKKNTTTIYKQIYRQYTYRYTKDKEFKQYIKRQGTNVKCTLVVREALDPSVHICKKYIVKKGKDEIRRTK